LRGGEGSTYSFSDCLASWPSLSKSAESLLGLIALASSGGYWADTVSISLPLGMMIDPLGMRVASLGRSSRDLLGASPSDSEAEEETDEVDEVAPMEMGGLG
jgi:hypothetical protein